MYRHIYDSKQSAELGQTAADLFEEVAKRKGWIVIKATKEQDYKEHWDYALRQQNDAYFIEVKGLKRLNRSAQQDDQMICIELQGNTGYPGWLYGKSTHIAFLMKEGFLLLDRLKLVAMIEQLVDINGKINPSIPNKKLHTIYRRVKFGHKDKIIYITKQELLSVPHKIWEVEGV